jgi:hypothetical protein
MCPVGATVTDDFRVTAEVAMFPVGATVPDGFTWKCRTVVRATRYTHAHHTSPTSLSIICYPRLSISFCGQ